MSPHHFSPVSLLSHWVGDQTHPDSSPVYASYPSFPQSWSSPTYSSLPPAVGSALLNHPRRSHDSIETASASISSLESDDSSAVTEDPQFQEHPHSRQFQARISGDSPIIHVPPFLPLSYMTPVGPLSPPGYDFVYPTLTTLKLPGPLKAKGPKPPSKQKILKYKSKYSNHLCSNGCLSHGYFSQALQIFPHRERLPQWKCLHFVSLAKFQE